MPTPQFFISTQGPLQSTIEDFWEMIFAYDVKIIIMLCNLKENGKEKCANYWDVSLKNYIISTIIDQFSLKKIPGLEFRHLTVQKVGDAIEKHVYQIQLTTWEDHEAPVENFEKIIRIIKFIDI